MDEELREKYNNISDEIIKILDNICESLMQYNDGLPDGEKININRIVSSQSRFKNGIILDFKKQIIIDDNDEEILDYMNFTLDALKDIQGILEDGNFDVVSREIVKIIRQSGRFINGGARRTSVDNVKWHIKNIKKDTDEITIRLKKLNKKEKQLDELIKHAKGANSKIDEKNIRISESLNLLTDASQHDFYSKSAEKHRKIADKYRHATNLWIVASIVFLGFLIFKYQSAVFNFDGFSAFLLRVSIFLVIFSPAFYFSRESNKHRQVEFRHEKLELELATFSPYVSELNNDLKDEVRLAFSYRLFGEDIKEDDKNFYSKMKIFKNKLDKAEKELNSKKENVKSLSGEIKEKQSELLKLKNEIFEFDDEPF